MEMLKINSFFSLSCFSSGTPAFNGLVPKINSFCSWQRPPAWHRNSTFASVSEKLFTVPIRHLEPSGLTLDFINANGRKLFTAKYKSLWWTLKCYLIFNIYIFFWTSESRSLWGTTKECENIDLIEVHVLLVAFCVYSPEGCNSHSHTLIGLSLLLLVNANRKSDLQDSLSCRQIFQYYDFHFSFSLLHFTPVNKNKLAKEESWQ